jgi:hypothetical protein
VTVRAIAVAAVSAAVGAWSATNAFGAEPPAEAAVVQGDISKLIRATYAGDYDTVLSFAVPAVVASMGGRAAAKATLTETLGPTIQRMQVESLDFPEPPRFVDGASARRYVVVPTRLIIRSRDERLESFNFQLGVRDRGSSQWHYFEGSRVTPQILAALFPDFPRGYSFPRVQRRKL